MEHLIFRDGVLVNYLSRNSLLSLRIKKFCLRQTTQYGVHVFSFEKEILNPRHLHQNDAHTPTFMPCMFTRSIHTCIRSLTFSIRARLLALYLLIAAVCWPTPTRIYISRVHGLCNHNLWARNAVWLLRKVLFSFFYTTNTVT